MMTNPSVHVLHRNAVRSLTASCLRKTTADNLNHLSRRRLSTVQHNVVGNKRLHRHWNVAALTSAASLPDSSSHAARSSSHHHHQSRNNRHLLNLSLAASAGLCGAMVWSGENRTKCEEYDEPVSPSRNDLMTTAAKKEPGDGEDQREKDEEKAEESRDEKGMMASSMMQLPALPDSSEPMFAVQRLRRLNGWAALEAKEDLKKVQLAQLLNDLYKLTKENTNNHDDMEAGDTIEMEEEFQHEAALGLAFDPEKETVNKEHTLHLIQQVQNGNSFKKRNFIRLVEVGAQVLRKEPTLVDLSHKKEVYVVGDLHASHENLQEVLKIVGDLDDTDKAVVFNGDFVDRGKRGVEVVCTLLLLKITYPNNVFLVRGNHEDSLLSTIYGFEEEVREKYGRSALKEIWKALGKLFSALPFACKTNHAAIMHGGIPSADFSLDQLEKIPFEERSKYSSVMEDDESSSELEAVCRDVLWSDPMLDEGLHENENRGLGKVFGTDVSRDFLENHGLHYLIRSHEVMDEGWDVIECGNNRYVLTVFSTSAYPDGFGDNKGAVLRLNNETGKLDPIDFMIERKTETDEAEEKSSLVSSLAHVVVDNKAKLQRAFEKIESSNGTVSIGQWARLMKSELEMDMDWLQIQPKIAPTKLLETEGEFHSSDDIDWREFLELNCFSGPDVSIDDATMESLFSNHDMLLTVFKYLDTDGNGKLDEEEFVSGITLLNERLPESRKFKDPLNLFKTLDFDGSGEIDLDEFAAAFNVVSKPPDRAVLSTIFKSLDTDNSGTVDIDEFREGVAKLNERLPRDRQVKDADALFQSLDLNGDGEVDVNEFSAFYF